MTIEIRTIRRKYEAFRVKNKIRETFLLDSIRQKGIMEPLYCVKEKTGYVLIDGYKRLRCAVALHINVIPVMLIANDELDAILHIVRHSCTPTLHIVEQAVFVNELKHTFGMQLSEIARRLERSKAWVSVRLGIFDEMTPIIRKAIFAGRFPLRAYMYTVRPFTRVNKKVSQEAVEGFVKALSNKGLSQRNIEHLGKHYFQGTETARRHIDAGKFDLLLTKTITSNTPTKDELPEDEEHCIKQLHIGLKALWWIHEFLCQRKQASFQPQTLSLFKRLLAVFTAMGKEIQRYDHQRSA